MKLRLFTFKNKTRFLPGLISILSFLTCSSLVCLWLFDSDLKITLGENMKFNSCVAVVFSALSLWFLKDKSDSNKLWKIYTGKSFAFLVFAIGLVTSLQYLFQQNWAVDELFVKDYPSIRSSIFPGRMSPISSFCFVLLGLGQMFLDIHPKKIKINVTSLFLIPLALILFLALVGDIYGESNLFQIGPYIRISSLTTVLMLLMTFGVSFSRPDEGPIRILTSPYLGGVTARRVLPFVVFLPIFLGWLSLRLKDSNHHSVELALSILILSIVLIQIIVMSFTAKKLNLVDQQRQELMILEEEARLQTEYARKELEDFFRQTPIPLMVLSGREHRFTLANDSFRELVGQEVLGKTVKEAFNAEEAKDFLTILDRVFKTGESYVGHEINFKNMRVDVAYVPVRGSNHRIKGILGYIHDVTPQYMARQRVETLADDLKLAVHARDEFLSIASHELKTPLTSLKLHAQLMRRSFDKNLSRDLEVPSMKSLILQTDKQVSRLTRLVDDMLDVSRIRSGHFKMDREYFNLADLVQEVLERLSGQFEKENYPKPIIKISETTFGHWDRYKIEQVLTNLLTNAIRYGQKNPVSIKVEDLEDKARLSVQDHGIGIDPEVQDKIFDRFARVGNPEKISGLGLGLFITKQIVTAHEGKIWVESKLGEGSTFFIELPKHTAQQSIAEKHSG